MRVKKKKKIIGTSHKEAKLFLERKRVGLNFWTDKYQGRGRRRGPRRVKPCNVEINTFFPGAGSKGER